MQQNNLISIFSFLIGLKIDIRVTASYFKLYDQIEIVVWGIQKYFTENGFYGEIQYFISTSPNNKKTDKQNKI